MNGKVKWFNPKSGYGFITCEDGRDVFVHYSAIQQEGFRTLRKDQAVTLEIVTDDKGRETAANVAIA